MAEIISRQAAKVAAGTKLSPGESGGVVRCCVITSPAVAAWAQNDTIAAGVPIPIGSRFLACSISSEAGLGSSVTLDVGIRDWTTKVAIDADGIAANVNVATAGRPVLNNGALVVDGVESLTTVVSEVYATLEGADPTDNVQLRIEVMYLSPD
jgi:hypothetical protein